MPSYNAISSPNNSKLKLSKGKDGIWVNQHMNSNNGGFLNPQKLLLPPWLSATSPVPSLQPGSPQTPETSAQDILIASNEIQQFLQSRHQSTSALTFTAAPST